MQWRIAIICSYVGLFVVALPDRAPLQGRSRSRLGRPAPVREVPKRTCCKRVWRTIWR